MHGSGGVESGNGMHAGGMESYFRTDLTETEKTAIKALVEANRDSVKTILDTNGTGAISDTTKTELQTLQSALVASLLQYVATDKQTEFSTKFTTFSVFKGESGKGRSGSGSMEKPDFQSGSGSFDRIEKGNKSDVSLKTTTKKQSATEKKIASLVDTKLATFSTDSEKLAWMEDIVTKIDSVLAKISSSSKKRTYTAIKSVMEDKIDTINGTDSTDTTLDSLLQ